MDIETVTQTSQFLSTQGVTSVIFLLLIIIIGLIWERLRLIKKIDILTEDILKQQDEFLNKLVQFQTESSEKLDRIHSSHNSSIIQLIDTYHNGNLQIVRSLGDLTNIMGVIRNTN